MKKWERRSHTFPLHYCTPLSVTSVPEWTA